MTLTEKRKFQRLDSLHLMDYLVIDNEGIKCDYSMARTLDVSINGIKVETLKEIPADSTLQITLGIEENLVNVEGQPTHTHSVGNRFTTGVEFIKASAENRKVIRQYVDAFKAQKDKMFMRGKIPAA